MYNWEQSSKKKGGKKAKKTGTVVLHVDEKVDLTFDRLLKETILDRDHHDEAVAQATDDAGEGHQKGLKTALMTTDTAQLLQSKMGFTELLPSQAQTYRGIFKGRDVILHSRTGSGKTLAYALPLVERHLILESKDQSKSTRGPFLLIFVFSDELAFQTRSVLQKVYGKSLKIGVAGMDDVILKPVDILIGTVMSLDRVIRGSRFSQSAKAAQAKRARHEDDDDDAASDDSASASDDDAAAADPLEDSEETLVDVSHVRAIVVDEVDTTLGPRYSALGRRMRSVLKVVRRSNGSLSASLMSDFRSHHYVLCGATIPNWVIKAAFLGPKKFYYQLVGVGSQKLPPQLECFSTTCTARNRLERGAEILRTQSRFLGRTVVFGTAKQLEQLQALLSSSDAEKKAPKLGVRALLPSDDETTRIKNMEDFNAKLPTCNTLLCTDVAARGLDFADVDTVVMVSLPNHVMAAEMFVHRAGRTARVGRPGRCLLIYDPERDAHVVDAVTKHNHIVFRKLAAIEASLEKKGAGAKDAAGTASSTFELKVKAAIAAKATSAPLARPEDILAKCLGEELMREKVANIIHPDANDTQRITFSVPLEDAHLVTSKLWKYDVKEVLKK